jgi:thioredoxin-related protein
MIRKVVTILTLLSLHLFADIKFSQNYEAALAQAQKENKLIALTIVSTNCPWCHELKKKTLKDPKVEAIVAKHFVYVMINKDVDAIPNDLPSKFVPTTYFLDKNGREISRAAKGYWPATDFADYLNDALKKTKRL